MISNVKAMNNLPISIFTQIDPTLGFPVDEWEITRPTERAARIKKRLLENERQIDVERARYATQSYRQTEGEPMIIRRAKMLLHLVRQMSLTIHPDEVIVGNRSLLPRMGIIAPEPGVINARVATLVAKRCTVEHQPVFDEPGHLGFKLFSRQEIEQLIESSEIIDPFTLTLYFRAKAWL